VQASEATKARIAAEQQADEATKAREIAEEALAIAKQTEADRLADRDARDAPVFDIVPKGRTQVRVTLKEGPPEVVVRMTRLGTSWRTASSGWRSRSALLSTPGNTGSHLADRA
jgi:hypothetical protein